MKRGFRRTGGLECGASGARLALLSRRDARVRVDNVFLLDTPVETRIGGRPRRPVELVRDLLIQRNLARYNVVFAADEAAANCFVILPRMTRTDARNALLLQARKLLSWEGEAPLLAHTDSEYLHDRIGSLVALADWTALKPWCAAIESVGGTVDDITVRACAFQALAARQGWNRRFQVLLVADVGAAFCRLYALDGPCVRFAREIPVGGDAITRAMTAEISTQTGRTRMTEREAESFKVDNSLAPPRPETLSFVEMTARPVLERLSAEIRRSVQFFGENTGRKVEGVFLTGGTGRFPALRADLEKSLGLPFLTIDPFDGMEFATPAVQELAERERHRLAVAVGLALVEHPDISLAPLSLRLPKRVSRFAPLAAAAMLVAGFLPPMGIGIHKAVRIQKLRGRIESDRSALAATRTRQAQLAALRADLEKEMERLERARAAVGHEPLWPGVLNALAEAVPPNIVLTDFSVAAESKARRSATLAGYVLPAATDFEREVASLVSALGASPFFRNVRIAGAEAERTETALGTLQIECDLVP